MEHSPGFLALVNDAKSRIRQVDIHQYQKMPREQHLLIDIREDHEWEEGHATGAIHMSRGILERDIEVNVPEKSTPMVLYCGGGYRSALAADSLRMMGYTNVISLDGGWRAWNEAELPVEPPPGIEPGTYAGRTRAAGCCRIVSAAASPLRPPPAPRPAGSSGPPPSTCSLVIGGYGQDQEGECNSQKDHEIDE